MSMDFKCKLPIPLDIKCQFPLSEKMLAQKAENDKSIKAVFSGQSDKLILVIGPCSADFKESVLDYVSRLRLVQDKVRDKIIIIPRIYTNKPRTTGEGYKGMLHQPQPDGKPDMLKGIIAIRDIHICALRDYGFTCADEMLYPDNYRYLSDLLSYVAVGARSVENQQHRLTASGLETPVGMKNPASGDLSVMLNAVYAAQNKHTFIYRGWEVESDGNEYAHSVLRGYTDANGQLVSNYHYDDIMRLYDMYTSSGLKNPAVIIDTNHSNSSKNYLEQIGIAKDVLNNRSHNADIKQLVKGFMIESYIEDGAQQIGEGIYGKSITDPCLGWDKTEKLILNIADSI